FYAGAYRFGVGADDGVRLWVDGALVIDAWRSGIAEHRPPIRYMTSGYHELILEYFEDAGEAEIRLWWE
ncbi:PA14 domain-containing protein, partial [Chloroflexota bacterium]